MVCTRKKTLSPWETQEGGRTQGISKIKLAFCEFFTATAIAELALGVILKREKQFSTDLTKFGFVLPFELRRAKVKRTTIRCKTVSNECCDKLLMKI